MGEFNLPKYGSLCSASLLFVCFFLFSSVHPVLAATAAKASFITERPIAPEKAKKAAFAPTDRDHRKRDSLCKAVSSGDCPPCGAVLSLSEYWPSGEIAFVFRPLVSVFMPDPASSRRLSVRAPPTGIA